MNRPDPKSMIELFLLGELDEESARRVGSWLEDSPEGRGELEAARQSLAALEQELAAPADSAQIAERIVDICRSQAPTAGLPIAALQKKPAAPPRLWRNAALSAAGLLAVLALLAVWIQPWRLPRAGDAVSQRAAAGVIPPDGNALSVEAGVLPMRAERDAPTLLAYRQAMMESDDAFYELLIEHASALFPPSEPVSVGLRNEL